MPTFVVVQGKSQNRLLTVMGRSKAKVDEAINFIKNTKSGK